jgi:hypothetical protein
MVELKAAESWTPDRHGCRRYSFGGHGSGTNISLMRQLLRSGAGILLLSWTEPGVGPAGLPAEDIWYLPIQVCSVTRAQKELHLRRLHLNRTRAQLEAAFPHHQPTRDGLKALIAQMF